MSDDDKWENGFCKREWIKVRGEDYEYPGPCVGTTNNGLIRRGKLLYDVPVDIRDQILEKSLETGIPYIAAANLLGSESGYKATAVSPTGAMGLAQMVSDTLYEKLYQSREDLPPKARNIVDDNIEKYNSADPGEPYWYKYRIREGGDENAVRALAKDEDIAIELGFKHMEFSIREGSRVYMEKLSGRIRWMKREVEVNQILDELREKSKNGNSPTTEELDAANARIDEIRSRTRAMTDEIDRQFTTADLKVFYVCGPTGGAGLLEALADPVKRAQNHRAADYAPDHVVKSNEALFFKDYPNNTIYRDVEEFYEHMIELVGETPLPNNLKTDPSAAIAMANTSTPKY
ncbi:MAG: transglycosylase SLT domain-containing protein [Pseudomonadota bacterium]